MLSTSSEDFEDAEEVFEAVGAFLQEAGGGDDRAEEDARLVCGGIMRLIESESGASVTNGASGQKVLDAPVQMVSLVDKKEEEDSIWIQKMEDSLKVDTKKLEKAEQQLQKKLDKTSKTSSKPANRYKTNEATASQVISRKDARAEAQDKAVKDVRIENFDVAYGEKALLKGANLVLVYGRRYGMVGRNGLGKSTLLKMISGGQLVIPSHISVLHVEQEVTGDDTLALQSVLESDEKREALLKEEREVSQKLNAAASPGYGLFVRNIVTDN